MRYLILSCALLCAGISFSQSKKKQIERLEQQVDSLLKVDKIHQDLLKDLENESRTLKMIIRDYVKQIDQLNSLNLNLEEKLRNQEAQIVKSELYEDLENAKQKETGEEPETENIRPSSQSNHRYPDDVPHRGDGRGNPFGSGGSGGGQGNGEGGGFGSDSGSDSGPGTGIGNDHRRVRQNDVNIENVSVANDATINYQLTVDADGNVVAFRLAGIRDMSLDEALVNKVGTAIKKQVKYNRAKGSPLVYQYYTIHIKAE